MKKLLTIFAAAILIATTSCSSGDQQEEKFNAAETQSLIKSYDANGGSLTPEQYTTLIKNTRLLFADIKERMKALIDITDHDAFIKQYEALKADAAFMQEIAIREQAWRVLVLGQKNFTEDNLNQFGNMNDECMLIDYYDDCIRASLEQPTDTLTPTAE